MVNPLYILYSERSGSNFLRMLITKNQSQYFGPSPAHLLKNLSPNEHKYGDLIIDSNFLRLINDAIQLCKTHYSPWEIVLKDTVLLEEFTAINQERNVFNLMHFLYQKYSKFKSFTTYINKENDLFLYIKDINQNIYQAKFIYLYRDPRDVILSQLKRPTSHRSIYKFAKQWKREQQKCLTITENSNSSQVHVISYEDLIEKDDSLDAILSFLNVKLEQNNINNVDVGSSHEWKNINSDVMKTNKQKFLKELSKREIQLIESVCKEEMKVLNYTLVSKDLNVSKIYVYYDILIGKYIGKWNKLKAKFSKDLKVKDKRSKLLNKLKKSKSL